MDRQAVAAATLHNGPLRIIDLRRLRALVAKQLLDVSEIRACLQQMRRERVTERVDRSRFVDPGYLIGTFDHLLDGSLVDVAAGSEPREEPSDGTVPPHIYVKRRLGVAGQDRVPVLPPLALTDMDQTTVSIDVLCLQTNDLPKSQPGGVG